MAKPRVCIVCQRYQLGREYLPLHRALEEEFDLVRFFVDEGWPATIEDIPTYERYEAIIWCVRFRELITRPAFDWKRYSGVRIMYDQDAYQNFSLLAGDRYLGAWPKVYHTNKFDTLICTGKATCENLLDAGVRAVWVPKAYDPNRFFDKGGRRNGICYFGELYSARKAMLRHVKRKGIEVRRFRCSFFDLNDYLNEYRICLICNMVSTPEAGRFRLVKRLRQNDRDRLSSGPEVMLKNFEVAATGCVQFCDELPELSDLGFEDGETAVTYTSLDELIEKLEFYRSSPETLGAISKRAAALCSERHTWAHRADMFAEVVAGREPKVKAQAGESLRSRSTARRPHLGRMAKNAYGID